MESGIRLGRYRHFKGREYLVIGLALHSETLETMVVYKALYDDEALWVRPISMWTERAAVEDRLVQRFTWIAEA